MHNSQWIKASAMTSGVQDFNGIILSPDRHSLVKSILLSSVIWSVLQKFDLFSVTNVAHFEKTYVFFLGYFAGSSFSIL